MDYRQLLQETKNAPARLEQSFQEAVAAGGQVEFTEAVDATYADEPDNLLFAAWHYRLAQAGPLVARQIPWLFALAAALINGLLLWLLADDTQWVIRAPGNITMPYFVLVWGPLAGIFVLAYLTHAGALTWRRWGVLSAVLVVLGLWGLTAYSLLNNAAFQEQYLLLATLHLPVVVWTLVGVGLLHGLGREESRFAFLLKSLELFVLGGLFLSVLWVLTLVTLGLFQALGIEPPPWTPRLLIAGGGGLVPVLAVAIGYDASRSPAQQSFDGGLGRLLAVLLRLFLPLTLAVLVVYLGFVPFYFWRPFENRDVLIIYNAMLFAVLALLLGVTPMALTGLGASQQRWLRRGIVAVAVLAAVVSLYALSAITYRTWLEGLTPNRVAFIGWNVINTLLLGLLLVGQMRRTANTWLPGVHQMFGIGCLLYALWGALVIFGLPLMF